MAWRMRKTISKVRGDILSMTMQEVSERYQIPMEILKEYEGWNLWDETEGGMENSKYNDDDLQRLEMIMTLHNIGFEGKEIEQYMRLYFLGNVTCAARMKILRKKREQILDKVHFHEKRLEDLDYLRYKTLEEMEGK